MNWYKFANNEFKILSYNNFGEISILSGTGKRHSYIGSTPPFIRKLKTLISQKRWGEGWQMLRKLREIPSKQIPSQKDNSKQQLEFNF